MLLLLHHPLNVKRKGVKYSSGGEYRLQPLQKVEWIKMRSALTSDRPITPNKILERLCQFFILGLELGTERKWG